MKETVLIYDDDIELLELCQNVLRAKMYKVEIFSSCDDVYNDVIRVNPDIIMIDLRMPGIGAQKAIENIKGDASTKHIPVIVFSAVSRLEVAAAKIYADGYLAKPFEIEDLSRVIKVNLLKARNKFNR